MDQARGQICSHYELLGGWILILTVQLHYNSIGPSPVHFKKLKGSIASRPSPLHLPAHHTRLLPHVGKETGQLAYATAYS